MYLANVMCRRLHHLCVSRYPTLVDKALEDMYASLPHIDDDGAGEEGEHRPKRRKTKTRSSSDADWLHCFISLALPQSRHQLLSDGRGLNGGTLVLSVHHHNPSMRAAAVKQLGENLLEENMVCRCMLTWVNCKK